MMKRSFLALFSFLLLLFMLTFSLIIPSATSEPKMTKYSVDYSNLGISSISATKKVVGLNCRLSLGINVTNYGVVTETVNATFYANSTTIREVWDVVVDGQNSTIVVFNWTIIGFTYGNYSISACITPVFNETDLSDNFIDDLWIFVTIPGDINADKNVDIYDAIILASLWDIDGYHAMYYPWYPPPINPVADFDDNGMIDIYDAIILAGNFGRHWE